MPAYIFSTGRLLLTPAGGDETELAVLHDIAVEFGAQKKDLEAPPAFSLYPVATGFFNAECTAKVEVCSFNPDAIAAIVAGASGADGGTGGVEQDTIVAFSKMRLRLFTTDVDGVIQEWVFGSVLAPNLSLVFGRDDFMRANTTFVCYPDADGNVVSINTDSPGLTA